MNVLWNILQLVEVENIACIEFMRVLKHNLKECTWFVKSMITMSMVAHKKQQIRAKIINCNKCCN
jgi:hypothetical protein